MMRDLGQALVCLFKRNSTPPSLHLGIHTPAQFPSQGFVQAVSIDINSLCFGGFHSSLLATPQSPLPFPPITSVGRDKIFVR